MPCRSDHMEAQPREIESRAVAKHLVYLIPIVGHPTAGRNIPDDIRHASTNYYGNRDKLDEWTALLCRMCKVLESDEERADEYLWDGRNKDARALADWWERHKEFDRQREAEENKEDLKLKALSVLVQALSQTDFGVSDATYDGDNDSGSLIFKLDGMEILIRSRDVQVSEWKDD